MQLNERNMFFKCRFQLQMNKEELRVKKRFKIQTLSFCKQELNCPGRQFSFNILPNHLRGKVLDCLMY